MFDGNLWIGLPEKEELVLEDELEKILLVVSFKYEILRFANSLAKKFANLPPLGKGLFKFVNYLLISRQSVCKCFDELCLTFLM